MKKVTIDVDNVAKLANLPLSDADKKKYSEQLAQILDYVDQLQKVDTKGVEPTYNVTGQTNVFRADEVANSLSQEQALQNATNTKQGFFVTKGVFEEE